jgi:hypothetical protein
MGLGGLARQGVPEASTEQGEGSKSSALPGWASLLGVPDPARRQEQQKVAADDDRKIRFTISGADKRMTKEDFIREVRKLDAGTRSEVVDKSTAPKEIKALAKQQGPLTAPIIVEQKPSSEAPSVDRRSPPSPPQAGSSSKPDDGPTETPAERRRRLSVLAHQQDDDETPAERRRRQAALGEAATGDVDSDVEEETVTRRGIRFAEEPERGRR